MYLVGGKCPENCLSVRANTVDNNDSESLKTASCSLCSSFSSQERSSAMRNCFCFLLLEEKENLKLVSRYQIFRLFIFISLSASVGSPFCIQAM